MAKEKNKKRTGGGLRKRMIFYFLLMALANIFVAGEILIEIKSQSYRENVAEQVSLIKEGDAPVSQIFGILDTLARKFIIMILVLIVISAVVLCMFVWQIASPIQYMINQAEKMADGDLSTSISIKSDDEIAVLGHLINDLSINLQEVVAQIDSIVGDFKEDMDRINDVLKERPLMLSSIKKSLDMLDGTVRKLEMVKNMFVLYTIDKKGTNES